MPAKVGIILAVDGEREFRAAMAEATSAANAAKAELKQLTQEYDGNANSLEALKAKQNALKSANEALKRSVEAAKSGQENAQRAVDKYTDAIEKQDSKISAAKQELDRLKKTYGEGSDQVKKQEKALDELNREQDENKQKLQAAQTALNKWDKKVADASTAEKKNSQEIERNNKYLKEAEKSTDKCATSIDEFGKSLKDSGKAAEDAGRDWDEAFKIAVAGKAMDLASSAVGMLTDKLVEGAKAAVEVGSQFEYSMSNVAALSGATGTDLDKLSTKAQELGRTTKFSASEAADAFGYMSLAGWDTEQMLDGIDGVMQLAASSGMDLASASDMVTDYLSAFGLEASNATRMADMLAYAQANSNTTAQQLGEAYGNCAAGMNTAGQSIETTTAMLEAMANQGTKGSEAGTALNAVMSQITQKMKDGAIQIGDTAVAVQDSEGNFRDLTDIMADVEAATDGMGTAQKSAALSAVFNRTALKGVNQILNEGVDKVKGYRDELNNSQGAAKDMADTMQDNLQGAITEANSAAEGLGIALFNQVSGPLTEAVDTATKVINAITDAITPQKSALDLFIEDIEKQNDKVRGILDAASEATSNAEVYASKLDGYKDVLVEVAEATEATEFQKFQVEQIVRELGSSIPELAAAWDEETGSLTMNREEIIKLMDSYKSAMLMQAYTDALAEAQRGLAEATLAQVKAETAHKNATEELNTALETGAEGVEVLTNRKEGYETVTGELVDREKEAAEALADSNKNMEDAQEEVDLMTQVIEDLKQQYPELASVLDAAGDAAEDSAEGMGKAAEAVEVLDEETQKHIDEVTKAFHDMEKGIGDAVKNSISFFEEFNGGSEVNLDDVLKNLQSQVDGLSKWKENMEKLATEAGSGMTQEFYDYLVEMGPKSASLVDELVQSIDKKDGEFEKVVEEWTKAMELSDTSQVLASYTQAGEEYAKALGTGMEGGITEAQDGINTAAETAGKESGETMAESVAEGIEDSGSDVTEAAETVVEDAAEAVDGKTESYTQAGEALAKAMAEGIKGAQSEVTKAAGDVANEASVTAANKALFFNNTGQTLAKALAQGIKDAQSNVTGNAGAVASDAATMAGNKSLNFNTSGQNLSKALGAGISAAKGNATSAASAVASAAASSVKGYGGSFSSAGRSMSQGLGQGIRNGKASAVNAAIDVAVAALNAAKRKLGISSPSKEFERIGEQMMEGMVLGVSKTQKAVEEVLEGTTKKIISASNKDAKRLQKQFENDFGAKRTNDKGEANKNFYSDYLRGAEKALDQYKTMQDMSAKEELAYWKEIQKHLKKRSDEWYDVQKKINGLNDDIAEEKKAKKEEEREKRREEKEKKKEEKRKKKEEEEKKRQEDEAKREELYEKKREKAEKAKERRQTLKAVQEKILEDFKVYNDLSLKAEAQYWNKARKQFKEGTEERIEADRKYYEASKAWHEEEQRLKDEELAKETEINDQLIAEIEELNKAYEDAVSERKNSILSSMSLFEDWDSAGYTSDVLLRNLSHQVEGLKLWESELEALNKKDLPEEFVKELEAMGPDATASIYSLNRMTDEELAEYVKLWKERGDIAEREAKRQNEELRKQTDEAIQTRKEIAEAEIQSLKDELSTALAEIGEEIDDSLVEMLGKAKTTTEDAVSALVAGIDNEEKKAELKKGTLDVTLAMGDGFKSGLALALADATTSASATVDKTVSAMKKSAKTGKKTVKNDVGLGIAESVAAGLEKGTKTVTASARLMVTAAIDAAYDQADAEWSKRGLGGLKAIDNLTAPAGKTGTGISKDPTQENLENLLKQVALIGELLTQTQLVMDTGQIVGALQPALSQEQAAVAVRRNRGAL